MALSFVPDYSLIPDKNLNISKGLFYYHLGCITSYFSSICSFLIFSGFSNILVLICQASLLRMFSFSCQQFHTTVVLVDKIVLDLFVHVVLHTTLFDSYTKVIFALLTWVANFAFQTFIIEEIRKNVRKI